MRVSYNSVIILIILWIIPTMENLEEKNTSNTPNKKKVNIKTILVYSLVGLSVVGLGVGTGIILKRQFGQTDIDYTGFDPENYRMDSKGLLKQYEKNPNRQFTPAELVNIGLEKYRQCENCYSIGIGNAKTIVDQTIRNAQIKVGDHYFEESISYSKMVSVANRVDQFGENESISLNKGKATGSETVDYKSEVTTYKADDYKKAWGKTLDEMFIYIISNETVIAEKSKVEKTSEHIKVSLALDTDISTYYYKLQMKEISNLDKLPVFQSLNHTYIFSKNMDLEYCMVDEQYQAQMGVTASIHNTIEYYYHPNVVIDIPKENETIDYSIEGENHYE